MATVREPALIEPKGPGITALECTVGALLLLGAGGFCVYAVVRTVAESGETGAGWGWAGMGVALAAAFVAWIGLGTIIGARDERRATLRLAAQGVEATALVLAVASTSPTNDYRNRVRLTLRLNSPGLEPFEYAAKVLKDAFGGVTQGTVLPARVNAVTREFTVEPPPAPPAPGHKDAEDAGR
ncbi:hypothetical protein AB0L33_24520 [Streptomyces sp. NPDC052299]|uniref:hypothetical protein n=1 Tax=Streptomyces sp. NPDC052299 TaxID=3155054 RepID=UPI0034192B9A